MKVPAWAKIGEFTMMINKKHMVARILGTVAVALLPILGFGAEEVFRFPTVKVGDANVEFPGDGSLFKRVVSASELHDIKSMANDALRLSQMHLWNCFSMLGDARVTSSSMDSSNSRNKLSLVETSGTAILESSELLSADNLPKSFLYSFADVNGSRFMICTDNLSNGLIQIGCLNPTRDELGFMMFVEGKQVVQFSQVTSAASMCKNMRLQGYFFSTDKSSVINRASFRENPAAIGIGVSGL